MNGGEKERKIISDYIEGIRITTPEILQIARRMFLRWVSWLYILKKNEYSMQKNISPSLWVLPERT